jgi:flavin-dependent dehydrogenase
MFDGLLSLIGQAAQVLAPQVVQGAGTAIKAGKALSDAFKAAKSLNGGTAPADAEAQHNALFDRVMAHADATFDRAERGDT